jgi:hypothetical protein
VPGGRTLVRAGLLFQLLHPHLPSPSPSLHHQLVACRVHPDREFFQRHLCRSHPHRHPPAIVPALVLRSPLSGLPVDDGLNLALSGQRPQRLGPAIERDARQPDRRRDDELGGGAIDLTSGGRHPAAASAG